MWETLFGPAPLDVWRRDCDRISRQLAQLKVKVTMRSDPSIKAANYREMRLILKDLSLLDKGLQDDILKNTRARTELWARTEELKRLTQDVKDVEGIIDPVGL